MLRRRLWVNRFIGTRNIKIAFMIQSIVTSLGVLTLMFQTTYLDQASRWEMDLSEARCHGCCALHNDSLRSIIDEPYLSEKLHKFSRAVRKYDIPEDILNILHEAEHKMEQFENELQQFKQDKLHRISQLRDTLIEEDVKEQDLTPRAKPKWKKEWKKPSEKVTTKPNIKPTSRKPAATQTKSSVKTDNKKP